MKNRFETNWFICVQTYFFIKKNSNRYVLFYYMKIIIYFNEPSIFIFNFNKPYLKQKTHIQK
jgi:hypothetical protein